jgi:hypothetical protein
MWRGGRKSAFNAENMSPVSSVTPRLRTIKYGLTHNTVAGKAAEPIEQEKLGQIEPGTKLPQHRPTTLRASVTAVDFSSTVLPAAAILLCLAVTGVAAILGSDKLTGGHACAAASKAAKNVIARISNLPAERVRRKIRNPILAVVESITHPHNNTIPSNLADFDAGQTKSSKSSSRNFSL